jgi:CSLREA domain-containing protein
VLIVSLLATGLAPLHAQSTFTVTSTGDGADANTGDGICADGAGACTLRAAIEEANATAGLDNINFAIAGTGPHMITPAASLPAITDPVVIDGYTQSGASANTNPRDQGSNAVFMIVLDAVNTSGEGLDVLAGGSTVRGLRIENATDWGIGLRTNGGNTVEGNHILLDGFVIGVNIETSDNTIGGTTPAARNIIGGGQHGIMIFSGAGNSIQGNLIGTDAAGTSANGNGFAGVTLLAAGNTVGGTTPGAGNVISGNVTGISADHVPGAMTLIQGNLIGTDVTGTVALGNTEDGMFIQGMPYTIGGTTAAARNVISGNTDGIEIGDNADDLVIQGNYVGVDITGTAPIPNSGYGIRLHNDGHIVGGTEAGAGNVIGGSGAAGIFVNSTSATVQGNLIGVDAAGTGTAGNVIGVRIENATSNTIGGSAQGAANIISGNVLFGVQLIGNSSGNVIEGNYIGTNASGASLGNGVALVEPGVLVNATADGNQIARNTIAFNGAQGVFIEAGTGVHVSENRIHSNGELGGFLGIDLGPSGVTGNDAGDADAGPNNLQNFPLVTLAYRNGGTVVEGTLNSAASTTFTLEFFANSACDASDHGEGETFLGSAMVTTDGAGDASFTETLATAATAGDGVAATATDPDGNTSEFSACVRVNADPVFVVTSTDDDDDGVCSDGHCTLREAIEAANTRPGTDAIHFDIPGAGPHTIQPGSALPAITGAVTIDGYTQPGASANTNAPDQGTNAVWMVVLDASQSRSEYGLNVLGGSSTVRGLSIEGARAPSYAIALQTNGGNTVEGNTIVGTGLAGVLVTTSDNTIGGTTPAARNVIGDTFDGISIESAGRNNAIQGNLIGTDAAGTGANGNSMGIRLQGPANTVGGAAPGAGNVVSGNSTAIRVTGDSAVIQGNLIGTDVTGTVGLGNTTDGLVVDGARHATIAGNVISGTDSDGVFLNGDSAVVAGNSIGVDITGTAAIPNTGAGIWIHSGEGHAVGGTAPGEGNLIAFNGQNGIVGNGGMAAIEANAIHSNGGLGIDLSVDGVTANDPGDADTGPNGLQNFPTIDFALAGSAELEGTFSGAANTTLRIEFFSNDQCDGSGYGEGQRFLGFTTVTTDGSGDATFSASLTGPASPGDAITATATDEEAGETSEFSACVTGVGYDVAADATQGTVIRGQDATYDVTVTAVGGTFDRDVTLACDGLPSGASCAFTPAAVQPGATEATAALVVSTTNPDTPTGSNDFSVVGTFNTIERMAAATVTVTDFTVLASPDTVTVTGGQNATFTVTVAPDGPSFAGAVTLSCSGLPAGASCSFAPGEVTPGGGPATSTLTVSTVPLAAAVVTSAAPARLRAGLEWRALIPISVLLLAGMALARSNSRPRRVRRSALAFGLFVLLADVACGGDPMSPGPQPVTTTFSITGTSGDLVHSTTAAVRVE